MEQNHTSSEKKESILKTLAIIGFISMLLLVAWLSIQLVHLFPSAFTSLASLADGVSQYQETTLDSNEELLPLTVTSNTSLLNTGETMTINWSEVNTNGTYVFAHGCIDGIAITHETELGDRAIDCDTNYLIGDTTSLTIGIESEKNRYTDVPFTVSFLRADDNAPRAQGTSVVTIVNTDIDSQLALTDATPTVSEPVAPTVVTSTPNIDPPAQVEAPAPVATQPVAPAVVYEVPTSNPDGYVDLAVAYIGTGEIINDVFVPGPVNNQYAGAVQFSVKNVGTKTSGDWAYGINLPNEQVYQSANQVELRPNERAVLTVGFPASDIDQHTFAVTVKESTDINDTNDSFAEAIVFAS